MRVDGWERRFATVIDGARYQPFEWGAWDCFLFASEVEMALVERRSFSDLIGRYDDAKSALRLLKSRGWISSGDAADEVYSRVPLLQAQRGDFVELDGQGEMLALGVCIGRDAAGVGPHGLEFTPLSNGYRAWRVA